MTPASPLPWQRVPLSSTQDQLVTHGVGAVVLSTDESPEGKTNRVYIAHACNNYPAMLDALRAFHAYAEANEIGESETRQYELAQQLTRAVLAKCDARYP